MGQGVAKPPPEAAWGGARPLQWPGVAIRGGCHPLPYFFFFFFILF